MSTISIEGYDKAAVLAALFNAGIRKPVFDSVIKTPQLTVEEMFEMYEQDMSPFDILLTTISEVAYGPMTIRQASILLVFQTYFHVLFGRELYIELAGDRLNYKEYNRVNGKNAAQLVLLSLHATGDPDCLSIRQIRNDNEARVTKKIINQIKSDRRKHAGKYDVKLL